MQYRIRGDLIIIGVDAHLKVRHFPTDVRMVCHRDRLSLPDHQFREFTFQLALKFTQLTLTSRSLVSIFFRRRLHDIISSWFCGGSPTKFGIMLYSMITIILMQLSREWQTDTPVSSFSTCSRNTAHSVTSSLLRPFFLL